MLQGERSVIWKCCILIIMNKERVCTKKDTSYTQKPFFLNFTTFSKLTSSYPGSTAGAWPCSWRTVAGLRGGAWAAGVPRRARHAAAEAAAAAAAGAAEAPRQTARMQGWRATSAAVARRAARQKKFLHHQSKFENDSIIIEATILHYYSIYSIFKRRLSTTITF